MILHKVMRRGARYLEGYRDDICGVCKPGCIELCAGVDAFAPAVIVQTAKGKCVCSEPAIAKGVGAAKEQPCHKKRKYYKDVFFHAWFSIKKGIA